MGTTVRHSNLWEKHKDISITPQCSQGKGSLLHLSAPALIKQKLVCLITAQEGRLWNTAVDNLSVIRRSMGQLRNNPVASPGGSPVCNRRKPLLCPSYVTMEPYQNRAGTYQSRGRQSQVTAESSAGPAIPTLGLKSF